MNVCYLESQVKNYFEKKVVIHYMVSATDQSNKVISMVSPEKWNQNMQIQIYINIDIYIYKKTYKKLAYEIMEAEKSHDRPHATWRTKEAGSMAQSKSEASGLGKLMCNSQSKFQEKQGRC